MIPLLQYAQPILYKTDSRSRRTSPARCSRRWCRRPDRTLTSATTGSARSLPVGPRPRPSLARPIANGPFMPMIALCRRSTAWPWLPITLLGVAVVVFVLLRVVPGDPIA